MRHLLLPLIGGLMLASCASNAAKDYQLDASLENVADGTVAYLVNYDNGDKIDSALVEGGRVVFAGKIESPVMVRILVDGNRKGNLILEPAQLVMASDGGVTGGELNTTLEQAMAGMDAIQARVETLPQDSTYKAAYAAVVADYNRYMDSVVAANAENPVGYLFFVEQAYELTLPELQAALEKYPSMKQYQRPQKLMASMEQKEKTSAGKKFIDFTIKNDTVSQSLSDYAGKGRYTLVDFWASWCGPCIRETKVLKEIREEFKNAPLDILGVAVWDEPENTLAAIERHQLPWPQIINTQSVATDLYGIPAIPCIILIGPDGTIISRDLQGEELKESVRTALRGASAN